jgi:ankyrin repeat protein
LTTEQREASIAPTPLRGAAHSDIEITRLLVRYGADVHLRDIIRVTALHEAARRGRVDVITELLRHGANVNAKEISGKTPLGSILELSFDRNLNVIPVLLQNGASLRQMADWDVPPGWSRIATMMPLSLKGLTLLCLLREIFVQPTSGESENQWLDSTTDFHLACLQHTGGRDVILTTLLDMDLDLNAKDVTGLTALEYAAIAGEKNTIIKLIQKGADIHCLDRYGSTLLHRAVLAERIDLIELLVEEGENINVKTSLDSMQVAALVDAGFLQNIFREYAAKCQLTPLQLAILGNRRKSATVLLKHNASLEPFAYPRMPIHFPAARHGMDFFQQLLEAGATTSDTNDDSLPAYLEGRDNRELEELYLWKLSYCPIVLIEKLEQTRG